MPNKFDYNTAFSRNIGWITETEQSVLRAKRVAIAGLGGVGGSHLLTLTRLGIGAFNISDFDAFDIVNFNRQAGATVSHLDRPKVDVLTEMARDINPELDIRAFPSGVDESNVDAFLEGVDCYVDGLDFFAVKARHLVFRKCAEKGIPAVTAAPLGMGTSVLNFMPGKMTFEEYFRWEGQEEIEQLLRFLLGLSPVQLQMRALVDNTRLDLENHKGPSTPMGCELCAGVAATQVLKILLRRGPVVTVPRSLHFDAFNNVMKITWRPGGNNHPLQRLGLAMGRKGLQERLRQAAQAKAAGRAEAAAASPVEKVLDVARWAPSGDNTQPWRFELISDTSCVVHGSDTRDWCVYDLRGRASQIAVGALLENIAVAASAQGLRAEMERLPDSAEEAPQIDVQLVADESLKTDPLYPFIKARVTQRRPLATEPLTDADRMRVEQSLPEGYSLVWIEGEANRERMAKLLFLNAHIRLTIPEAYRVHKEIIEWNASQSVDRIPDQAVGLDPVALKAMRWAMGSWGRVQFLNKYLAGTLMPRIQMDYLPGRKCAAHFLLVADGKPVDIDDYFAGGRALQRFWLACTSAGLQFQPEMTPLIFSGYVAQGIHFTDDVTAQGNARRLRDQLQGMVGGEAVLERGVFMGRVGYGAAPKARSLRLALDRLKK